MYAATIVQYMNGILWNPREFPDGVCFIFCAHLIQMQVRFEYAIILSLPTNRQTYRIRIPKLPILPSHMFTLCLTLG